MHMIYTATVTSQGQITIPAKFRKILNLNKRGKVFVSLDNERILLEPVSDFMALGGSLHKYAKKNMPIEKIMELEEKAWEDAVVEKYGKRKIRKNPPSI